MKFAVLYFTITLVLCSCSDDNDARFISKNELLQYSNHNGQTGIVIENGPRQGFQYHDHFSEELSYRYTTSTITNDSNVPVTIKIAFGKEYDSLRINKLLLSDVFLLPRSLTPKQQQFDPTMSKELKDFLDSRMGSIESLNITLNPNEHIVMTFGALTKLQYKDPFTIQLKIMESEKLSTPLALVLGDLITIPCGEITFTNK